jgi:hypothetical protein
MEVSMSMASPSAPPYLFTLNGADINKPYTNNNKSGASNNTLGANDIAEAAVVLNAFSAQYGHMARVQVNFVTKSGINQFHGNLSESYSDAILNANDFFKNVTGGPRGCAIANQFAGSLGGPVWKNKTFFCQRRGLALCTPLERCGLGPLAGATTLHSGPCFVWLRRGEILQLRWDQVDWQHNVIRLERKQTKGKKARWRPSMGNCEVGSRWLSRSEALTAAS